MHTAKLLIPLVVLSAGCELGLENPGDEVGPDAGFGSVEQPITQGSLTTQAPWIVSITLGGSLCSASVLSEHWLLTAAHCVHGKGSGGTVTVRYASSAGAATSVYSGPAKYHKNPSYSPGWFWPDREDDVALIRLTSGSGINLGLTGRASLWGYSKPWSSSWSSQRNFSMIGWGLTDPSGGDDCVAGTAGMKRLGTGFRVDKTSTATKTVEAPIGDTHACGGDSGTPWTFVRGGRYIAFAVHSGRMPDFLVAGDIHQAPLITPKYSWIYTASKNTGLMLDCKTAGYAGGVPYMECEERTYSPEPPPPVPGSSCPSGQYCCEPAPSGDACSSCQPFGTSCF